MIRVFYAAYTFWEISSSEDIKLTPDHTSLRYTLLAISILSTVGALLGAGMLLLGGFHAGYLILLVLSHDTAAIAVTLLNEDSFLIKKKHEQDEEIHPISLAEQFLTPFPYLGCWIL